MFFLAWVAIKHGNIRLGGPKATPEFSDVTYFAMLFSAGVAVGLFFYGISEPLSYRTSTWYANQESRSIDEIDQMAIGQTLYHWGFGAWASYIVVAVCAGLVSYNFGLPMTYRSLFYPLLGEYTWGWIGDLIDGFTIVATVAGICTSLGLGAFQIVDGFQRIGAIDMDISEDEETRAQCLVILVVTIIATISVMTGLDIGIKYLSMIGFGLGMLLLFLAFALENTKYQLNLMVQSFGYYFQWCIFQLNFHTDAFGQLNPGEGRSTDGEAAPTWFMDGWTIFYMAWWTAWSAFVGIFIARISKGRTIFDVVVYGMGAPLIYSLVWFCVFGGIGLRQVRQAEELVVMGETYFDDKDYFLSQGSTYCYDVPQTDVVVDGETVFTNTLPGITPVCLFVEFGQAWYNVMYSFSFPEDSLQGFGSFMSGLSIVAVIIYFVTSSDSGSLVVDHLASNGKKEHHWLQRMFWALTEGAVAIALLLAGGSNALRALQAASIVSGVPFTIMLLCNCLSIVRMCNICTTKGSGSLQDETLKNNFSMPMFGGVFNIFETLASLGQVHDDRISQQMDRPSSDQIVGFFTNLIFPFLGFRHVVIQLSSEKSNKFEAIIVPLVYAVLFLGWIALFALSGQSVVFAAAGWSAFLANGCLLTSYRMKMRESKTITGNIFWDYVACTFLYPQAITQMALESMS